MGKCYKIKRIFRGGTSMNLIYFFTYLLTGIFLGISLILLIKSIFLVLEELQK